MVVQLEADGLPTLLNLLHRENMLAAVRAQDLGFFKGSELEVFFKRAEAVLIADRKADARTGRIPGLHPHQVYPEAETHAKMFTVWVRMQASLRAR